MKNLLSPGIGGHIAQGSALTFFSGFLSRGTAMAQSIFVARWLDPYQVGVFSIVSYVLGVAGALSDLGMPVAAMKLIAEFRTGQRKALKILLVTLSTAMLAIAGLTGLILLLSANLLASLYREPVLALLFKMGAFALFLSLLGGFVSGTLQGFQRIDVLAVLGPAKGLAAFLITVVLLPRFGLAGILLASMGAEAVGWLIAAKPFHRVASPSWSSERLYFSWALLGRAFALSVPIFLNGLILWGTPWAVRSYLAQTRGYTEVGLFQVADSFSRILLLIPFAVAVPFAPTVSELDAVAPVQVSRLTQAALRSTALVTLPAALFLFLAAKHLLVFVYGSPYAEAGFLAALLVMAAFFQSISVIVWSTLIGMGRMWAGFLIQSTGQVLLVVLTLVLVPRFGLVGLGASHIVAFAVILLLGLFYLASRGITLGEFKDLFPLSLLGWLFAWAAEASGTTGLIQALLVALGIVILQAFKLTELERGLIKSLVQRLRSQED